MSENTKAPAGVEMPEPVAFIHWSFSGDVRLDWYSTRNMNDAAQKRRVNGYLPDVPLIPSDQLQAYAAAKAQEARERALDEAEKASDAQIERWVDDRARYAASECAAAIRALKDKT